MPSDLRLRPSPQAGPSTSPNRGSTRPLRSPSTRPQPRPRRSNVLGVSPLVLSFFLLLSLSWSFISIHYHLAPYSWLSDWKHRHDKIVQHRPAFKHVERYSPEHRFRPAASPVIKIKDRKGNVKKVKGLYH
ncbi:BZ3500_MvSof-1268-A1-R1_Chr4-1g06787 [Microbotryum saponariae]|uniref:BZ3500_MvSof-1268-A1-R1_Chr4-1g06787 protein n=1 Tax=Microbotryum saponariae TaxID=289078 RepID=A0A2X0LHA6_9BASI|nr:BZ3500_MvSof-1268-A1-R1_Chr4-1g06787 [Microbotryum saponariae]SDA06444.1 BZ3501_MvSof-1269-A2-R1_Chr4-1g06489 [Microbotryum saponariae]